MDSEMLRHHLCSAAAQPGPSEEGKGMGTTEKPPSGHLLSSKGPGFGSWCTPRRVERKQGALVVTQHHSWVQVPEAIICPASLASSPETLLTLQTAEAHGRKAH